MTEMFAISGTDHDSPSFIALFARNILRIKYVMVTLS